MKMVFARRVEDILKLIEDADCRHGMGIRIVALLLFLAAVVLYSWNSDDAYHSYVMARHLAEGKGLVYNTGYRVSASTCPLLTLFEAVIFLFTDSANICGLLTGVLFSGLAAWILLFRLCSSSIVALCVSGVLLSSRTFLSFTTSGLENPLLFFLGASLVDVYRRNEGVSKWRLLVLALFMSLVAMARMDSVLLFIPMVCWTYMARTKVSFPVRVLIGFIGLLPFVLWMVFSTVYYGFPFPNTFYAKLYTGIPHMEYIVKGLKYFLASWLVDPMLLIVPVLAVLIAAKERNVSIVPIFLGLALYSLYVVSIGGDFMSGRHLTQQFFLSTCMIAVVLRGEVERGASDSRRWSAVLGARLHFQLVVVLVIAAIIGFFWNWCADFAFGISYITRDVWDERKYYLTYGGEVPLYKGAWEYVVGDRGAMFRDDKRGAYILQAYQNGDKGLVFGDAPEKFKEMGFGIVLFGKDIFAAMDLDLCLTDVIALQDPLMARLKVNTGNHWIVGHIVRDIPEGYKDSVASGVNKIEDRSLHEYYDKLLLVTRGALFNRERLEAIIGLNLGRYDYLLLQYERNLRGRHGHSDVKR